MQYTKNLPTDLGDKLGDRSVILFDGVCVLCSAGFQWTLKHDTRNAFHFTTAQSDFGQALYKALILPTDNFETFIVITDGQIFQKARASAAVFETLGGWWKILSLIKYIPRPIADWGYDRIAKNRYRLFGKTDVCMMPGPDLKDRFL